MLNWLRKKLPLLFGKSLFGNLIDSPNPKIVYGTTTGDDVFSNIPALAPVKGQDYKLAGDLGTFKVVSVNQEADVAVVIESTTNGVFEIELALFEFLFVEAN
jgi:hypothetical protein